MQQRTIHPRASTHKQRLCIRYRLMRNRLRRQSHHIHTLRLQRLREERNILVYNCFHFLYVCVGGSNVKFLIKVALFSVLC